MNGTARKVGIITHYYKSRNFGGVLQAYALCRYLRGLGYDAEQICYAMNGTSPTPPPPPFWNRLKRLTVQKVRLKLINRCLAGRFRKQAAAMTAFGEEQVPHSEKVYTAETIRDCRGYDAYITGSDQVWNPDWYEPAFFLTFVPEGGRKIAYAASLGHSSLSEAQAMLFRESLRGFSAVSVREEDAVELLSPLSPVPVERLLDPVLLLSREQWDEICADRLVKEPYVFCYFLGERSGPRALAEKFAKKRGLKTVCVPHLFGTYRPCDRSFGDKRLYGVSPREFLSLIKHADYIFTDSFHALVFSELYGKEYAVFRRSGGDAMSGRIYSAAELFGSRARFCEGEEQETMEYLESLPPADPDRPLPALDARRKRSREFLMENLTCQEHSTRCETPPTASPEK